MTVRSRPALPSCLPFGAAVVALSAALAFAVPARAEPVSAQYAVYFGGLHALNAEATWERGAGRYRLIAEAESQGFLGWLTAWKGTTETRGCLAGGKRVPGHTLTRRTDPQREEGALLTRSTPHPRAHAQR